MKSEVIKLFDAFISTTFKEKPEIKQYLLKQERKMIAIENLCYQIKLAEHNIGSIKFDQKKYQLMIKSVAKMFCNAALEWKKEQILSSAEKKRRISDADSLKEAKGSIEELKKDGLEEKTKVFIP